MSISKLTGHSPAPTFESIGKTATDKGRAGTASAPVAAESAVKLSPLSEKLKSLSKDYAASTAFDEKRVEALKLAIANGTFKVNAEAVADKLIAEAKQLGAAKHD